MEICGLFFKARASACLRERGVPAGTAPCAGGIGVGIAGELVDGWGAAVCAAAEIASATVKSDQTKKCRITPAPPHPRFLPCDARLNTPPGLNTQSPRP